ncbi:MAG: hypothetical protein M5T61_16190 [Acidimicrobiia bacterium]|nr:hypothetical protein [Acidimicrobiia bacterium]
MAGLDDLGVAPAEAAGGGAPVGGHEGDLHGAGSVVEGGDGADVASVEGLDGVADGDVAGGVLGSGEAVAEDLGVVADEVGGVSFDGAGVDGPAFEGDQVEGRRRLLDGLGVGVLGEGEVLAAGGGESPEQLVVGVGLLAGERDEAVVADQILVEGVEFGGGDDEPVRGPAAGEDEVAGFAVEPVEADGDGEVPGAALGAVGGGGVGVSDGVGGEVVGGEDDVEVVVVHA